MSRRLLLISGLSGSGKSTAARVLEDQGFFVVDNLPLVMLPEFMERVQQDLKHSTDVAVVIDVRNRGFLADYATTQDKLRQAGCQLEILFLKLLMRFCSGVIPKPVVLIPWLPVWASRLVSTSSASRCGRCVTGRVALSTAAI